jgi:hypothetical protein
MQEAIGRSHQLRKPAATKQAHAPVAPRWPSFRGTSRFVGTSHDGRVNVFVDPTLGQPGLKNAQDLVNDADRVMAANDDIFGTRGGSVNIIVFALDGQTDGTGGADHMGCDFTTGNAIEVCASFGNSDRVSALFEAELSECSMNGNLCGFSTGEGLSRWCAAVIGNNALADFATAPTWQQDGMPDFVTRTDHSDTVADSTGCAMAFISWLISLGHDLKTIAPAMVSLGDAGTLAQLYARLTGDSATNALPKFMAAVQNLPNGITSDDPFGGGQAPQIAHLDPATIELAARVFSTILADLSAGKLAAETVASVHRMVGVNSGGTCSIRSRRLRPPSAAA